MSAYGFNEDKSKIKMPVLKEKQITFTQVVGQSTFKDLLDTLDDALYPIVEKIKDIYIDSNDMYIRGQYKIDNFWDNGNNHEIKLSSLIPIITNDANETLLYHVVFDVKNFIDAMSYVYSNASIEIPATSDSNIITHEVSTRKKQSDLCTIGSLTATIRYFDADIIDKS